MIRIEENTNEDFLDNIKDEWQILCDACSYSTPFQYPQWLIPWWRYFGGSSFRAVTIRENGVLIALGLFYIYKEEGGIRKCCLLGTGISDYLDIPVVNNKEKICFDMIYNYLMEIKSQWDECDFQELRADSFIYKEFSKRKEVKSELCSVCLNKKISNIDQILYEFPKKLRNNLRRSEKKLAMVGSIEFIEEPENRMDIALNELIILHSARWINKHRSGVLNDSTIKSFHFSTLKFLYDSNLMRIFSLRLNKRVIAAYHVFLHRKRAYAYLGGFDPELVDYSPGSITLYYVICTIAKRGYDIIDFLRGEEAYKRYWNVNEEENYKIKITIENI